MRQQLRGRAHRAAGVAGLVLLVATASLAGPAAAHLQSGTRPAETQPTDTWPKIGHDAANTGVSPDPLISSANAAQLGVRWMAPTGTTDYSSPVVEWNATLGETLVYQGNENGYLTAFEEASGQTVWSDNLGSAIRDTPLVEGNNVWVADTFSPVLYKLDAATGAVECSTPMVSTENGSPTIGAGPGGAPTIFIGVNDLGTANGPIYAVNEADCSVDWQFSSYNGNDAAGTWDPLAFATDADGNPLLVFGTADPDSTVYAVNAATGVEVWSYQAIVNPTFSDDDFGAGASITAPGVNGFADGVVYIPGKDGYVFALDLTTGALIWDFNFGAAFNATPEYSRATAAVAGDDVIFGGTMGVACLNATTGAVVWQNQINPGGEVLSDSAVVGPAGQQVVAVTDLGGDLSVLDLATGHVLYTYPMGGFSVASVSDVDGNLLANSSAGYLYDFAVGGANAGAPTTAVTSPAPGTTVANPNGSLTISGTASGGPLAGVDVAVQEGGSTGTWWNAAAGTFTPGYANNPATLASPGAVSSTWSIRVPIPSGGGTYSVQAAAVGSDGLTDTAADAASPNAAHEAFNVSFLKSSPHLTATNGIYVAPGTKIPVSGSGFAAGESVTLSLAGTTLATVTTAGNGSFPATQILVPATAAFGTASLVGTGVTSGKTSTVTIDVSNEWTSANYASGNTAMEPNDLVLRNHVSPVGPAYLVQAWSYPTGASVETTAAFYKNVLYFGNDAGTVTALSAHQSVPLWTYQAGSAVKSSPVVANGLVIFGTSAGSIVALNATTGAVVWNDPTTSAVTAAPSVSGNLVVVGTADGTVYAVQTGTGAALWQATTPGAVDGAAAIDPANHQVMVGAGDEVVALGGAKGTTLWTAPTHGTVTAYPTVSGGEVYVGDASGTVYALKETNGATTWTYKTTGAVTQGGSLMTFNGVNYVVGTSTGNVYFITVNKGKLFKSFTTGAAVTGISSSPGFAMVTTAAGSALGYKYTGGASWAWSAPGGFASSATIVNGVVYLTGLDQTVRAFTVPGVPIP